MDSILIELTVLFMREFGWSLSDAERTIGTMSIKKLNEIVEELNFQRQTEAYERAVNFGAVMATIWNTTPQKNPRPRKAQDMVGRPPRRKGERSEKTLREAAEEIGIRIPEGGKV